MGVIYGSQSCNIYFFGMKHLRWDSKHNIYKYSQLQATAFYIKKHIKMIHFNVFCNVKGAILVMLFNVKLGDLQLALLVFECVSSPYVTA